MHKLAPIALIALLACNGTDPGDTDLAEDPMLEGSVYRLNVNGLTISGADDGLNDLVKLFFSQAVLARLTDVSDSEMTMALALGDPETDPIVRNPCFGDISLPPVALTDLSFALGPQDLAVPSATGDFTIAGFSLAGTISEDGDDMDDLVLDGEVDFRLAEGSNFGTPEGLCESFTELGVPCGACSDGELFCATLNITGLTATRVEGVDWVPPQPEPGECDPE
jgi:hypothetical protein